MKIQLIQKILHPPTLLIFTLVFSSCEDRSSANHISELKRHVHKLENDKYDLESKISDLEREIGDLEIEKANLVSEKEDLVSEKEDLESEKEDLEIEKENLGNKISNIETEFDDVLTQIRSMGITINLMIADSQSMPNMSTANMLFNEIEKLKRAVSDVENEF